MIDTPILIDYITPIKRSRNARRTDPASSHAAAKNARGGKAEKQRFSILCTLQNLKPYGLTNKEIGNLIKAPYMDVVRRASDLKNAGLIRMDKTVTRDGCHPWYAN